MQAIVVIRHLRGTRQVDLSKRSVQFWAASAVAGVLLLVGALGFGLATLTVSGESVLLSEVRELRQELHHQAQDLDLGRSQAERDLDALAMKLGELQAAANRLGALGQRLVEIGQLDSAEFNFDETPAVGGPEDPYTVSVTPVFEGIDDWMEELSKRFEVQSRQLDMLETLLAHRDLDASLMPKGRPVRSGWVSSNFGWRLDPFTGKRAFHAGVDFHGPRGSDVLAVADGIVTWSGWRDGYGNTVEVDHGNSYITRYGHNQENLVEVGERVSAGATIAKMGSTGRSTASHVHFEVLQGGKALNPIRFIRAIR